jgi:hypothetical protein
MMQINAKDRSPTQQIFDRLVAQKGGDPVAAQQEYTRLFGDKPDTAYRQELLKKKADVISGPMGNSELGLKQLAAIDAEIAKLSRTTAPAKTATMADIQATAKARGKTVQETLAAAKAQGFVVQ